ncbi:MAG: ABC transporter permease [Pseudomonadota bacterium]
MSRTYAGILAAETGAELTQSFRAPEFLLPTLALPVAFYMMFGVLMSRGGGAATYLLATYGIFAVMGPSLFGFGVGVAGERERGWLELKRAAPAPASTFIGAKLGATIAFAAMALMPIYAAAAFMGGVELPKTVWLTLFLVHLSAVFPFSLIGLSIGFSFSTNGAVAIANIVFLSFAVIGGLWFPATFFPGWMVAISNALPSFHLAEIALTVVDAPGDRIAGFHATVVAGMTLACAALAGWTWSRQR